jgi:hypothetical protein
MLGLPCGSLSVEEVMVRILAVLVVLLSCVAGPAAAMDFSIVQKKGGQLAVLASGEITRGDGQALAQALSLATRGRNGTKEIWLSSPGGTVGDALDMADVMDADRVSTVVPAGAICASACASVLFVSGKYRTVERGGALLIHSCYDARDGRQVDYCNLMISAHAQYEGASGATMMALQQVAGTHSALLLGQSGAACFGLTGRAGRAAASRTPPCLQAAKSARRGSSGRTGR